MSDIFISYVSEDREKAQLLAGVLEAQGWSVFWDRTIPPGKRFDEVIETALDESKCVVVLWSKAAVSSDGLRAEAEGGLKRGILVPALIEEAKIPLAFRRVQTANLANWSGGSSHPELDRLLKSVEAYVGPVTRVVPDIRTGSSDVVAEGPPTAPDSKVLPKPPASEGEIVPAAPEAQESKPREDSFGWHCQRKVARTEFSTDDRELGRPELTPLGECGGAVELEIVS